MGIDWGHVGSVLVAGATVASSVVAVVAAWIAWRNARDAHSSAVATRMQADVSYASLVAASPGTASSDVVLDRVSYRWADDVMLIVASAGSATSVDGVDSGSILTRRQAVDKKLFAEIVIDGTLENTTGHEVLVTVRGRRPTRYPLHNQEVFVVDGQDRHSMVLPAGQKLGFSWVDRRSFDEWLELWLALEGTAKDDIDEDCKHLFVEDAARLIKGFGFEVVTESRHAERVVTVWDFNVERSALKLFGREDESPWACQWKIHPEVSGPIDDEVVRYRCHADYSLALTEPPTVRNLPGRL